MTNFKTYVINKKINTLDLLSEVSKQYFVDQQRAKYKILGSHFAGSTKPYADVVATEVAADVAAALHANNANGGRSLAPCMCVYQCCPSTTENKRNKKKKKSTQEMFAKFKDSCSGDVAVAVTFDAAVGCTTACLPGCASASAFACIAQALRLCLRLTHTLSLADSALSLCASVCVRVLLPAFVMRI